MSLTLLVSLLPNFYANCLATDDLCHGHLLATPASGKIWQEIIFMACEVRCCNGVVCYKLEKIRTLA